MDTIQALKTRRCIRAYTGKPVAREIIEDIVDCGRFAANGRNVQPWEFIVVTQRQGLKKIAELTGDNGAFIAGAALCIVVLCSETPLYLEDGCNASQNMQVAAHAHGLGAGWVAGDKKDYADTIRKEVGAPDGYKLVSLIPIGYPAEAPQKEKRPLAEVLHWERF